MELKNLRAAGRFYGDMDSWGVGPATLPATPWKLNMEPENKSLEKEIPFGNP